MKQRSLVIVLALTIAACEAPATRVAPTGSEHGEHDPAIERVKESMTDEFQMTFEPAGPHHELGTAPGGVELDLVGVPLEEAILSLPTRDRSAAVTTGLAYLPHLRDVLHGPDPVWDWVAEALACREDADASCNVSTSQGNVSARFTEDGTYIVLAIKRD